MATPYESRRARRALIAGAALGISAALLGGGVVVSNAWAIGHSVSRSVQQPGKTAPVAQRRWYARARFVTPEGLVSAEAITAH